MQDKRIKHGMSHSREFSSWSAMKTRCLNKNAGKKHYIGVHICDRWIDSFQNFYVDMGDRPVGTTLDRIDSTKGYSPENCRWADPLTQSRNKGRLCGVTKRGKKFIARIGIPNGNQWLGAYDSFFDACCARKSAENTIWGEA